MKQSQKHSWPHHLLIFISLTPWCVCVCACVSVCGGCMFNNVSAGMAWWWGFMVHLYLLMDCSYKPSSAGTIQTPWLKLDIITLAERWLEETPRSERHAREWAAHPSKKAPAVAEGIWLQSLQCSDTVWAVIKLLSQCFSVTACSVTLQVCSCFRPELSVWNFQCRTNLI